MQSMSSTTAAAKDYKLLPLLLRYNRKFLETYQSRVTKKWKRQYLQYDIIKDQIDAIKNKDTNQIHEAQIIRIDGNFLFSIDRVDKFMQTIIYRIEIDIGIVREYWGKLEIKEKDTILKDKDQRTLERSIRNIYQRIKDIDAFYNLNAHGIHKIAKKLEKLFKKCGDSCAYDAEEAGHAEHISAKSLDNRMKSRDGIDDDTISSDIKDIEKEFVIWSQRGLGSYQYYATYYITKKATIRRLMNAAIDLYGSIFRNTYKVLALSELELVKVKGKFLNSKKNMLILGMKIGAILSILFTIIQRHSDSDGSREIWSTPGLYAFSAIGNLIFFKMTWTLNVKLFSFYDINYIALLLMKNNKPNTLEILNESCTYLLILLVAIYIFFHLADSPAYDYAANYCPLVLVLLMMLQVLNSNRGIGKAETGVSTGLFTWEVIKRCFSTPFIPVTFRENYAADVLTSFNRIISDSAYAGCWIISGSFLKKTSDEHMNSYANFGTDVMHCTSTSAVTTIQCIIMIPLIVRCLQCSRNFYSTGLAHPHISNALKYFSSMIVVLYSVLNGSDSIYIFLICFTAIYKWLWDVVMDWGLFTIWPNCLSSAVSSGGSGGEESKLWFLRKLRVYPHPWWYYCSIVLDLVLRFTWTVSLLPESSVQKLGLGSPMLGIGLGSLEIFRRAMWGLFRVEYEHLKYVSLGYPGYVIRQSLHKGHEDHYTISSVSNPAVREYQLENINRNSTYYDSHGNLSTDDSHYSIATSNGMHRGVSSMGNSTRSIKDVEEDNDHHDSFHGFHHMNAIHSMVSSHNLRF